MKKIKFSLLFFLIYVLQLPAQYKLTVFVKYPFYYHSESDSPCDSCQKVDSIVSGLKVEAEITGLNGKHKKLVATTNSEGYANFVFANWENNDKVHLSEIENVELNFPSVEVAEKSVGTPVLQSVNTSDKAKSPEDTILFTLSRGSTNRQEFELFVPNVPYYDIVNPSIKFAVIADPHIGETFNDFPETGYDGEYPFENEPTHEYLDNVANVIEAVNACNVDFVVILGDITNSAEWSEFQKAKAMFSELNAPYIPVFGNHDTWPYWYESLELLCPRGGEEFPVTELIIGDWFYQHFHDQYDSLGERYLASYSEHANLRSPEENTGQDYAGSRYFNFKFEWQRVRFIVSDFNSRTEAEYGCHGTPGDADVHKGYPWDHSWDWLQTNLDDLANNHADRGFIILDHHPLYNDMWSCFTAHEIHQISDAGLLNNQQHLCWIGGHVHDGVKEPQPYTTHYADDIVAYVYGVKHAYAGNYAIFEVYDQAKIGFACSLDPSGEHYIFTGTAEPFSVSSYTLDFGAGENTVSGTGSIEETYSYNFYSQPSTRIKKVTLDAVIEGKHYIIAKPLAILANTLDLFHTTANNTRTYQATDSIKIAGKDQYGSDSWFIIVNSGDVTIEAGNRIRLKPGFEARNGCEFSASINPSLKSYSPSMSSSKTDNLSLSIPESIESEKKDAAQTSSEKKATEPIPTVFSCAQNYPNPFIRNTIIKYGLPKRSDVNLTIFNLAGQAVRTLVNGQESEGFKSVTWDGKNNAGTQVPQGIYFYFFKAGDFEKHHKMILVK